MVYVTDDGSVVNSIPWSLRRIFGLFTGVIYMFIMFFQTLINPDMNRAGNQSTRDYRPGSGSMYFARIFSMRFLVSDIIKQRWTMPRPPTRRLGRPNTGNNVDIPFFGGCSSCAR